MEKTDRGFRIIRFKDYYNCECSIQKSSLADIDCIWLGTDDATRMHLTRKQCFKLVKILLKFVLTGRLSD